MSEVLEQRVREVDDSLVLRIHPSGYRYITHGDRVVCADGEADWARAARFAADIALQGRGVVAIIGGGFCILPKLLRARGYTINVYEIEPPLSRFCPPWAFFVPGDYRVTMDGLFDVIVYDLGDPPAVDLTAHLKPGGQLLGVE
jgi:hypothetical protein